MTEKTMKDAWRFLADDSAIQEGHFPQDGLACRNIALVRAMADALIDERGRVDTDTALDMERVLANQSFVLVPGLELESLRRLHCRRVLRALQNPAIANQLQTISLALNNRAGQILIRHTLPDLIPSDKGSVEDRLARVAVLSAWLTYLRQSVGSCFATAPAIAVQGHHPARFLADMQQLLSTGSLTRIIEGIEVSVPLMEFWGRGNLWQPMKPSSKLQSSIGLKRGLVAAGLVPSESTPETKKRACQIIATAVNAEIAAANAKLVAANAKLVAANAERAVTGTKSIAKDFGDDGQLQIAPAQILRRALLLHFQLSQAELEQWEQRGQRANLQMLETALKAPTSAGPASRGALCQKLLDLESASQIAFKATADNALLRAWEYALASFSESKAQFQQWNLATSLGMQGEMEGVQQKLVELINHQIQVANLEIDECRQKIEQVHPQVIYTQGKLQNASSEQDLQWLKAEYYQVKGELDSWELRAQEHRRKGEKLAILSEWFVEKCIEGLRDQFQEVYDPDLSVCDADVKAPGSHTTEDAPAGFRLVAKEGRAFAASWTRVRDGAHFIEVLCRFFISIEGQFVTWPEVAELRREFSGIITCLIQHVRGETFLKQALDRLRKRTNRPGSPGSPPTPWAYISGGSLEDLLQQYCSLPSPPPSTSRWFDDVRDFWVYLIDSVQQLPVHLHEKFVAEPEWPLLMNSPDHAFSLKPGLYPFCESWRQSGYPYSWIRDHYREPAVQFYADIWLSPDEQIYLLDGWAKNLLERFGVQLPRFAKLGQSPSTAPHLRQHLEHILVSHPHAQSLLDAFDSHLFESLPICDKHVVGEKLASLFEQVLESNPQKMERAFKAKEQAAQKTSVSPFFDTQDAMGIPAGQLWEIALKCWTDCGDGCLSASDDLSLLRKAGESIGVFPPQPVEFADSNWTRESFAFAMNPGTLVVEIWCVERWGFRGRSMGSWRPWLNGSSPERTWSIFATTSSPDFF